MNTQCSVVHTTLEHLLLQCSLISLKHSLLWCLCCWVLCSVDVVHRSESLIITHISFLLELVFKSYISENVHSSIFMIIMLKASFSDCFTQHNHLAKEIHLHSDFILFACQHCFSNFISYITIFLCSWCAACTQCDYECIDLFWESLNCTCAKLFSELIVVKEKQTQLFIKIVYFQKVLNQSQNHVKQKISYLVEELINDNDEMKNKNKFLFSTLQLVNSLSLFFWKFIFISSQNIKVFLHNSWDFLWVLRYFLKHHILFT